MARTITASRRSAVKAPAKKKVVKKAPTKPAKVVKVQPNKALKKPATQKKVAKAAPKKTIPKAPKKEKAPKATTGPKGYTADEYAKFKDFQGTFSKKSNQELKDLLRKNLQSMSGNKDELIYKCADGATLGRIPRCPTCFGGRPKFDHKKGTYHCSGYRDDTDFHNCHKTFNKAEITRDPWDN